MSIASTVSSARPLSTAIVLLVLIGTSCRSPAGEFSVEKWDIGGNGGAGYLTAEPGTPRVFVSRTNHVMVVDGETGAVLGDIPDTPGVRGVVLIPKWGRGFTANAGDSTVTMFDLHTLEALKKIPVPAGDPDRIAYDSFSDRVILTTHGRPAGAIVALAAQTGEVLGTVELDDPAPDGLEADGMGRIFINGAGTGTLEVVDGEAMRVVASWSLAPCSSPTGLVYDRVTRRIFSACSGASVVSDPATEDVVATLPAGEKVGGLGWDPSEKLLYLPDGDSGDVTIVRQEGPDAYRVVASVPTAAGATTITVDPVTRRAYLFASPSWFIAIAH